MRLHRAETGRSLPPVTPTQLVGHSGPYTLRLGENGLEFNELEDLLLLKLLVMLQPRAVFEIGTFLGTRTALLASQGPADLRIFTLDLPPGTTPGAEITDHHVVERTHSELGRKFRGTAWESQITQLFGDSARFDFSPYHRAIDLIYIDGSHSYAYVVSDTHNAIAMVRDGGVLLWDDYGSVRSEYGTTRYLESLRRRGYPVFRLGTPNRRSALRGRAVMRVDPSLLERFEREKPR